MVSPVHAQDAAAPDSLFIRLASSQRAQVTRAELEASLRQIEGVLASSGYSDALKSQKEAEAAVIRRRLAEGDIRPGDVIRLAVSGSPELSGNFTVTTERTIVPPGAGPIPMGNLLRSEVEDYLRTQMRRFVRDPLVRADAMIRISLFGGVSRQGFFVVPASALLTDVIMEAGGGPSGNQKLEKSEIKRGDRVIVDRDQFTAALRGAQSLDQLNLQAGDEIKVGQRRSGRIPLFAAVSSAASLTWLLMRIF
jgi:protein involved in polysaccharide export with SLBB domain